MLLVTFFVFGTRWMALDCECGSGAATIGVITAPAAIKTFRAERALVRGAFYTHSRAAWLLTFARVLHLYHLAFGTCDLI